MDPVVEITIRLEQDGTVKIGVSGASNKASLIGLLEMAKHTILSDQQKRPAPGVLQATPHLGSLLPSR